MIQCSRNQEYYHQLNLGQGNTNLHLGKLPPLLPVNLVDLSAPSLATAVVGAANRETAVAGRGSQG